MNKVILMGRLARDPEIRYSQGDKPTAVAKYSLATERKFKKEGEPTADFINCVCFGREAEKAEKFFKQGTKIVVVGRIETGSYTNKNGVKVYVTQVIVEESEFAESKGASQSTSQSTAQGAGATGNTGQTRPGTAPRSTPAQASTAAGGQGFMNIPEGMDEEPPFY